MLTVTRDVYYCEFCKRHRMTKAAIEKHEPRCIHNPHRQACGWHGNPAFKPPWADGFTAELKNSLDTDWLRNEMDGCPACMLAVVVQAGLSMAERDDLQWSYTDEVERFRERERHADAVAW